VFRSGVVGALGVSHLKQCGGWAQSAWAWEPKGAGARRFVGFGRARYAPPRGRPAGARKSWFRGADVQLRGTPSSPSFSVVWNRAGADEQPAPVRSRVESSRSGRARGCEIAPPAGRQVVRVGLCPTWRVGPFSRWRSKVRGRGAFRKRLSAAPHRWGKISCGAGPPGCSGHRPGVASRRSIRRYRRWGRRGPVEARFGQRPEPVDRPQRRAAAAFPSLTEAASGRGGLGYTESQLRCPAARANAQSQNAHQAPAPLRVGRLRSLAAHRRRPPPDQAADQGDSISSSLPRGCASRPQQERPAAWLTEGRL